MAKHESHIRQGFSSVRPYIHGPVSLLDFVVEVFGAVDIERQEFGPDSYHVELKIHDSIIVIEAGELPPEVTPWKNSIYIYVEDTDATYKKAIELGAQSIAEPETKPYQERQAGFIDAGGNTWWVATFTL